MSIWCQLQKSETTLRASAQPRTMGPQPRTTGRGRHHSQQTNLQNKPEQRKWPVGFCLPLSSWKTWLPENTEEASEAVPKHLALLSHIWTLSPTSDMVRLTGSLKNQVETVPDFGRKPLKFQLTLKIRNKRSFSKVLRQCLSLHLNLGQVSDGQQSLWTWKGSEKGLGQN